MQALKNIKNLKQKAKLIIILSVEFIAIIAIILLVFFAGKKTHTVTFDLNGGILISGDLTQRVTQGQNAYPPNVAKYGHYLKGWSGSYKAVTRDVTVKAIWEYETTPGIEYYFPENTNYCEISGSFKEIQGEVYIGSYYNERQVLGIQSGAFKDRTGITGVYLLDGILAIESDAFAGCTSLEVIDIPSTVVRIGEGAFEGCESLRELVLPESLKVIEKEAFLGCTSLREIVIPYSVESIEYGAFSGCTSLEKVEFAEAEESDEAAENDKNNKNNKNDKNNESDKNPDSEENEDKPKEKIITKSIGAYAFSGCESLKEIVIPKTVIKIGAHAFNNPKMTIKLYISQEEMPEGYEKGWYTEGTTIVFNYEPVEEETEKDEKGDGKNDGGLWGNLS